MNKTKLPKLAKTPEDRGVIGQALASAIEASQADLETLRHRYEVNESYYRNQPMLVDETIVAADSDDESVSRATRKRSWQVNLHAPLVQPVIDSLLAQVVPAITGQDRYFTGKLYGPYADCAEKVAEGIQFLLESARFDNVVADMALITATCGTAFCRVTFDVVAKGFHANRLMPDLSLADQDLQYAGIVFDVIHPRDMAVYPSTCGTVEGARLVAHRMPSIRLQALREMQAAGRWLDDETNFGDDSEPLGDIGAAEAIYMLLPEVATKTQPIDQSKQEGSDSDHEVQVWTGLALARFDGEDFEQWYEVACAVDTGTLMAIRAYPYSRPWYGKTVFKREYGRVFNAGSIAQDIQGLQTGYSEHFNQLIDGVTATFLPMFIGPKGHFEDEAPEMVPGTVVEVENPEQFREFKVTFDGGSVVTAMQMIEELAMKSARVSANNMAGELKSGITATESAQIAAGGEANTNMAIAAFANGLEEMIPMVQMLAADNFQFLKQVYGDSFPVPEFDEETGLTGEEMLRLPIQWSVSGRSLEANKTVLLQKAQLLMEMGVQLQAAGAPVYDIAELARKIATYTDLPGIESVIIDEGQLQSALGAGQVPVVDEQLGGEDPSMLGGAEGGQPDAFASDY